LPTLAKTQNHPTITVLRILALAVDNTNKMTELDLIIDFHKNSERQGPGSEKDTLKALGMLNLPTDRKLKVADIGCGSGGQTITLARNIEGQITAVDLFPEFLDELNEKSRKLGLTDKIVTLKASMDELPFQSGELDLIWSEGAIYNIGFEAGIKKWKDYLKVGGFLAVSEITWITPFRPPEIENFWKNDYPEIDCASAKISQLENNGYTLVGYFYLSPESWIENYYSPMEARLETFLHRNHNSDLAQKVAEESKAEIELFRKFKDYYSYGFYLAKKVE
jgi:SAM-dependent methyltransferase